MTDTMPATAPPAVPPRRTVGRRPPARTLWPLAAVALLAAVPYLTADIPVLFDGPLNSPGTLQLLATCLVFGALATGYDLMFGRAGMLSFGHALYFAAGAYGTAILLYRTAIPLIVVAAITIAGGALLALALGAVALRTAGIAFAMVTLAFAQVGAVLVARDPGRTTGGEEGLPLPADRLPGALVGVANTVNLYWLALALLAVTVFVVHRIVDAPAGRVLAALRDDERRVGVLGLAPYRFRLLTFVVSATLAAAAGVVYVLLVQGASPHITSADLTLSLLVMAVLGGPGTRWGPMVGGMVFAFLDNRLTSAGGSDAISALPAVLRDPLSQPLFILGTVFILVVYFAPGGLAGRTAAVRRAVRAGKRRAD